MKLTLIRVSSLGLGGAPPDPTLDPDGGGLMPWQDLIFTAGSVFSLVVLAPLLGDKMAQVPYGTSVPSALIGLIYGGTFYSMGMVYSAFGAAAAGIMWGLIALLRSPKHSGQAASA